MSGISVPNLMGSGDMLSGILNSKLATTMYESMGNQRRGPAVPDSTRRAFVSGMEADARVARMGSQNMRDAEGMLTIAQTGVTGIKQSLTNMFELASDIDGTILTTPEQFAAYSATLEDMVNNMLSTVEGIEFNGFKLLDGSTPLFQLQAGNSTVDADMVNFLDGSIPGGGGISGDGRSVNLRDLLAHTTITSRDDAQNLAERLQTLITFTTSAEGALSSDIKGVNNLSTLLESQADIFDSVQKNHAEPDDDQNTPTSSADMLQALLNASSSNGNILSGVS